MKVKPYWNYGDISELTGVSIVTLRQWRARGKLPEPDYKPSPTLPLWTPATIESWWKGRGNGSATAE